MSEQSMGGFRISELKGVNESEAAFSLWKVYQLLESLNAAGRQRVYARWEHLKLIPEGDGKRWEKEFKRVTR